ncbi:MAG TPA: hypothetical protein VFH73_03900, partial [Polyangia bacterium]|nr:hypothetical protein [Polyangia bacterium]
RSTLSLYSKLAGGAEPPLALVQAEKRRLDGRPYASETEKDPLVTASSAPPRSGGFTPSASPAAVANTGGDIARVSRGLTAADDQFWRDNVCYTGGNANGCMPGWWGGSGEPVYVHWYGTRSSFLQAAAISGGTIWVAITYEGGTLSQNPVFLGEWHSFYLFSTKTWDCCGICACGTSHYDQRHHRWDIVGGAGKTYDWTYEFKSNTCWDTDCESP